MLRVTCHPGVHAYKTRAAGVCCKGTCMRRRSHVTLRCGVSISQCLNLIFASNTLCVRTITFLPVLFEVTTASCNLVGEKRMREKEGVMKC